MLHKLLVLCLCNLRQEFQLVAPRPYQFLNVFAASTFTSSILSPICSDVNTGSFNDFSCFLLSCWLYDQSRLYSIWVISQLKTFLGLFNKGISYLEKFSLHSVQYDTDALILAFSWLKIIKVRPDLLLD